MISMDIYPKTPMEIAAQLWCKRHRSGETIDPVLALDIAEAITQERRACTGWFEFAVQLNCNVNYYRDIVCKIGELFPIECRTQDDGGITEDILAAKVYEVVAKVVKFVKESDVIDEDIKNEEITEEMYAAGIRALKLIVAIWEIAHEELSDKFLRGACGLLFKTMQEAKLEKENQK